MDQINFTFGQSLFVLFMLLVWALSVITQIYGIYTCFCKKWYMGAVAFIVPGFAMVIGAAKLFFRRDLLK